MALDHTLTVDYHGTPDALARNMALEIERNDERFRFVKWAMQAYNGIRLMPPGWGILHQLNLEFLAPGYLEKDGVCYPDTLVGTDSHTCMIAGLGTVGWGVGGIEAEAAVLGQPVYFLTPDVVGVHVTGALKHGVTSTDLVLTRDRDAAPGEGRRQVRRVLRRRRRRTSRCPTARRSPTWRVEYGATIGYFPVDEQTCKYLAQTGRTPERVRATEAFYRAQGCFGAARKGEVDYSRVHRARSRRASCRASRDRSARRIASRCTNIKSRFRRRARAADRRAAATARPATRSRAPAAVDHGDVVIAAITSCTNTSNPGVMVAAGLVAKKAVERGLTREAVGEDFAHAGLDGRQQVSRRRPAFSRIFDKLGFAIAAIAAARASARRDRSTRQLEKVDHGQRRRRVRGAFGQPQLRSAHPSRGARVVPREPAARRRVRARGPRRHRFRDRAARHGQATASRSICATSGRRAEELQGALDIAANPAFYRETYSADIATKNPLWDGIPQATGEMYPWESDSSYIKEPPFLDDALRKSTLRDITGARALAILGNSITTDHISPIGSIKSTSPAGLYLQKPRRRAGGLQQLRRAPHEPRSDDARHVRERAAEEPDGAGRRRRRDDAPAERRADDRFTTPRCATQPSTCRSS